MSDALLEFMHTRAWDKRGEQYAYLADCLLKLKRPLLIVETGSMRPHEHPEHDGQSTVVWDWLVSHAGGKCFTVDIDFHTTAHTKTLIGKNTEAITCESIKFLSGMMPPMPQMVDLVFLDSMDWVGSDQNKLLSSLHHVGELAAIWPHVAEGGIVAVDDCYGEYEGKQALIECFFNLLKVPPVMTGPIYAWRKPCFLS